MCAVRKARRFVFYHFLIFRWAILKHLRLRYPNSYSNQLRILKSIVILNYYVIKIISRVSIIRTDYLTSERNIARDIIFHIIGKPHFLSRKIIFTTKWFKKQQLSSKYAICTLYRCVRYVTQTHTYIWANIRNLITLWYTILICYNKTIIF